jgi:hypothetical protein
MTKQKGKLNLLKSMIHLPSNFKIVWIVAIVIISAVYSADVHAQELDISTKKDSSVINGSVLYTIHIDVTKGNAPFSAFIYDKAPWDGGVILYKKEDFYTKSVVFRGIPSGTYSIVISSQNNTVVINRTIKL